MSRLNVLANFKYRIVIRKSQQVKAERGARPPFSRSIAAVELQSDRIPSRFQSRSLYYSLAKAGTVSLHVDHRVVNGEDVARFPIVNHFVRAGPFCFVGETRLLHSFRAYRHVRARTQSPPRALRRLGHLGRSATTFRVESSRPTTARDAIYGDRCARKKPAPIVNQSWLNSALRATAVAEVTSEQRVFNELIRRRFILDLKLTTVASIYHTPAIVRVNQYASRFFLRAGTTPRNRRNPPSAARRGTLAASVTHKPQHPR